MGSNTLVAICVVALFLLAVLVVATSYLERRPRRVSPTEKPTETWPERKEEM